MKTLLTCLISLTVLGGSAIAQDKKDDAPESRSIAPEPKKSITTKPGAIELLPKNNLDTLARRLSSILAQLDSAGEAEKESNQKKMRARLLRTLDELAKQSGRFAEITKESTAKLQARQFQLEAYNALATEARRGKDTREASYRVLQLRSAARSTRDIAAPEARALGDFWLLHADLFEINQADAPLRIRQRRAMERMEHFLAEQGWLGESKRKRTGFDDFKKTDEKNKPAAKGNPVPGSAVAGSAASGSNGAADVGDTKASDELRRKIGRQVLLGLLRLHEQQGLTQSSRRLIDQIKSSSLVDAQLHRQVTQRFAQADVIGRSFQANLRLSDGTIWSSEKHRGKPVLIVFHADWYAPSVKAKEKLIAERTKQGDDDDVAVLSVRLADLPFGNASTKRAASDKRAPDPHVPGPESYAVCIDRCRRSRQRDRFESRSARSHDPG